MAAAGTGAPNSAVHRPDKPHGLRGKLPDVVKQRGGPVAQEEEGSIEEAGALPRRIQHPSGCTDESRMLRSSDSEDA